MFSDPGLVKIRGSPAHVQKVQTAFVLVALVGSAHQANLLAAAGCYRHWGRLLQSGAVASQRRGPARPAQK